jgi:phosphoglycerate kinase
MKKLNIRDCEVKGKRVLARFDFNVPINSEKNITDDTRILAAIPSIKNVVERGGKLILMSHLGRPRGQRDPELSLMPVAYRLGELVNNPLKFVQDSTGPEVKQKVGDLKDGEILLLENLRFQAGEEKNDPELAKELASYGDIYLNDAFGTAHRAHASTAGVADYFDVRAAGFLMEKELTALGDSLENPIRPFLAVLGGAKIKGKIDLIKTLLSKVDVLLVGGGMMYTFFKASGLEIGRSIGDDSFLKMCKEIMDKTKEGPSKLLLPVDTIIAQEIDDSSPTREVTVTDIPEDWIGVDIGPKTVALFKSEIVKAKTVFWNGPMGVFEKPNFAEGTKAIARSVGNGKERGAVTVVGGGDSVAAINLLGLADQFSHISTGGGASLEFLEGRSLPGVEALCDAAGASLDA